MRGVAAVWLRLGPSSRHRSRSSRHGMGGLGIAQDKTSLEAQQESSEEYDVSRCEVYDVAHAHAVECLESHLVDLNRDGSEAADSCRTRHTWVLKSKVPLDANSHMLLRAMAADLFELLSTHLMYPLLSSRPPSFLSCRLGTQACHHLLCLPFARIVSLQARSTSR